MLILDHSAIETVSWLRASLIDGACRLEPLGEPLAEAMSCSQSTPPQWDLMLTTEVLAAM